MAAAYTALKRLTPIFKARIIFGHEPILNEGIEATMDDQRLDRADKAIICSIKTVQDVLSQEKARSKEEILNIGIYRFPQEIELLTESPGIPDAADICLRIYQFHPRRPSFLTQVLPRSRPDYSSCSIFTITR